MHLSHLSCSLVAGLALPLLTAGVTVQNDQCPPFRGSLLESQVCGPLPAGASSELLLGCFHLRLEKSLGCG